MSAGGDNNKGGDNNTGISLTLRQLTQMLRAWTRLKELCAQHDMDPALMHQAERDPLAFQIAWNKGDPSQMDQVSEKERAKRARRAFVFVLPKLSKDDKKAVKKLQELQERRMARLEKQLAKELADLK